MSGLIPAAIDGLVAVAGRTTGVQVFDGPEARWPRAEFVAIGLSPDEGTVPGVREPAGMESTSEYADIVCMARSWSGSTGVKPHRDRAYQIVAALTAAIEADRTLGGAVGTSEVTGSIYVPAQTEKGCVVDVVFTVRATQF